MGNSILDEDVNEGESFTSERIGVIAVAYEDGRIDVCLDLEKVEALWDSKACHMIYHNLRSDLFLMHFLRQCNRHELPMLAVYESIDLGIVASINDATKASLLQANHVAFLADPIHDDIVYVYHGFGVHVLNFNSVLQNFAVALKEEEDGSLDEAIQNTGSTLVQAILSTYSIEKRYGKCLSR